MALFGLIAVSIVMSMGLYALAAEDLGQTKEPKTGDYDDIEAVIDEMTDSNQVSFEKITEGLLAGDFSGALKNTLDYMTEKIIGELKLNKAVMGQIIGVAILGAIFTNFSAAFARKYVAETGFYLTYMIVFTLLAASFLSASEIAQQVVRQLVQLMKAIIPAFCLAMTFSSGIGTSGAFYEMMMIAVVAADWLMAGLVMNLIKVYVVLAIVNHMTKEDYLSKTAELMGAGINWVLKTILAVTLGVNMIQGMVFPAFDSIKNGMVTKAVASIPALGNTLGMAAKAAIGSGVLLKNAIGTAGVIVIFIVCAVPLVKLLMIGLMYRLVEAVIQPVSDERLTECIHVAGSGVFLLFKASGTIILLFVLSMAMVTVSSNTILSV